MDDLSQDERAIVTQLSDGERSVDDLIETMEKQKDKAYWVIYRESHQIAGYGLGIDYAEQDGRITELELFSFV